jgi:ketosteroid isomerase-like protein
MEDEDAIQLMQRHAEAWNAHDSDALLSLMTEDCIYYASSGKHPFGERHAGHAALKPAFTTIWETVRDASWDDVTHFPCGEYGFSTWTFRGTLSDGTSIEVKGLDLLRFRNGKICRKDTYRKNVLS